MPARDLGMQQQTQVMVRVQYRDVPRKGLVSCEVPSAEFEAGERGVQVGTLLVPWLRVHEYDLIMRQEGTEGERIREGARMRVRVVIDDGSAEGRTFDLPADRFESSPHAATFLLDRHVDADAGELVTQKLSVPWHRVVSVERVSAAEARDGSAANGDAGARNP